MKIFLETLDKFDSVCYNNQAFDKPIRRYDENVGLRWNEKSFKNFSKTY